MSVTCIISYLKGISERVQRQVLKDFKMGKYKILVSTSVAEEGLDIMECNIVIRYNYSTNEIGRIQTKGTKLKTKQSLPDSM